MTKVLNPEPLLRALHDAGVRRVIIGGFAVNAHGVIRPSKDLDIVPDPGPANLARLAALLEDLDARHVGLGDFEPDEFPFDPTRLEDLQQGANFRLETRLGDLDIMQWVAGIDAEPLWYGHSTASPSSPMIAVQTVARTTTHLQFVLHPATVPLRVACAERRARNVAKSSLIRRTAAMSRAIAAATVRSTGASPRSAASSRDPRREGER